MNKNSLRILLVSALPPPVGGDSTWAKNYLEYATNNNIQIEHVNTSLIGKRAKTTSDAFNLFDELKRCKSIWRQINTKLRNNNFSVAHVCVNCSPKGLIRDYISVKKIAKKNIPIIIHCHCDVEDQIKSNKIGIKYFKKIGKLAKLIFVLNKKSFKYVTTQVNTKVMVMPNFINENYLNRKTNIAPQIKKIVFVGHIRKTKGIDELVEAAKTQTEITFLLIGPLTNDYSNEQTSLLPKNIFLLGTKTPKEITKYLDESDVFVFPSYTEGFSVALLEEMSRGLPVIATNVGANEEMLENKGGIIIQEKNEKQLIEGIERIKNQKLRLEMSDWNYNKVKNEYTIKQVVQKMLNCYIEIIKN